LLDLEILENSKRKGTPVEELSEEELQLQEEEEALVKILLYLIILNRKRNIMVYYTNMKILS